MTRNSNRNTTSITDGPWADAPFVARSSNVPRHPRFPRRVALQAGTIGLLGLGLEHLGLVPAQADPRSDRANIEASDRANGPGPRARAVIYIFLSGGLSQLESFDLKPDAPAEVRGEFRPIATNTPGTYICEHLPRLAARSHLWSLVRSLTHGSNEHSAGHHIMLTGRSDLPPGFNPSRPRPGDWPSIAAIAGALAPPRGNLPPAVVLPERLVHSTGRIIPGQFAGALGASHDPWFIDASPFDPRAYGAYPMFEFDHQDRPRPKRLKRFRAPSLELPAGFTSERLARRTTLMKLLDGQCAALDREAVGPAFGVQRQAAVSLLTDPRVRAAFDVFDADPKVLDRYGRHSFGWSLLMARRLVEAGVGLVQVNLGNDETWDTHGNMFPHLKDNLFPPTDQSVSALLDDLNATGLLSSTLIVMAGEFGRAPRITSLPQAYKLPGRDHWGRAQTVFIAGGGTAGGRVVGSTDKNASAPRSDPQTPENLAATIYNGLGLPPAIAWHDPQKRPHYLYRGSPITGL